MPKYYKGKMTKFKIGDKIVRNGHNPDARYNFKGTFGSDKDVTKKGDILTISAVGHNSYSVEGAYVKEPNWSSMEQHFDLYMPMKNGKPDWKKRFANG